jgi:hypothetical protein
MMMRSMTRWTLAGFMALAALGAVAVLDVGSSTAEAAPSVSPFAGSWSGMWTVFEVDVPIGTGTFDWTISDAGRITGTVNTPPDGGTIVGHVGENGKIEMVGYAPADDPLTGNGVPFVGTAEIVVDGKLVVLVRRKDNKDKSLVAILEK